MKLLYNILWFEDEKEWYESIVGYIENFLKEKGFKLLANRYDTIGDDIFVEISTGKFDLVIVDHKLIGDNSGETLIEKLREDKIYTNIIFYSQYGEKQVRDIIKTKGIDGVFCADRDRDNFLDKVFKVIKNTIIKVEDINNIRGLFMACTGELDMLMDKIVEKTVSDLSEAQQNNCCSKIHSKFLKSLHDRMLKLKGLEKPANIRNLLELLESIHKWRAIKRLCSSNIILKKYKTEIDSYEEKIIKKRNLLAHVVEVNENHKPVLRSTPYIPHMQLGEFE
ncbi:MAG: hypothetical protein JW870_09890 [Candidatus Delongbacteria bacterium]|nr:hypothetical protein [Candidatus Delongbacteria bacterium]